MRKILLVSLFLLPITSFAVDYKVINNIKDAVHVSCSKPDDSRGRRGFILESGNSAIICGWCAEGKVIIKSVLEKKRKSKGSSAAWCPGSKNRLGIINVLGSHRKLGVSIKCETYGEPLCDQN